MGKQLSTEELARQLAEIAHDFYGGMLALGNQKIPAESFIKVLQTQEDWKCSGCGASALKGFWTHLVAGLCIDCREGRL